MEYIYIGKLVNTHGIKGEVRILSDFSHKDAVFKKGIKYYIGKNKAEYIVSTYRPHKNFDMVAFAGINNINDMLSYKGDNVYVLKESIIIDGYLNEDLIGLDVFSKEKNLGKVKTFIKSKAHDILVVGEQEYLIPNIPEFIANIDINSGRIDINEIEGLIDED